jgi:hypothetical protein
MGVPIAAKAGLGFDAGAVGGGGGGVLIVCDVGSSVVVVLWSSRNF